MCVSDGADDLVFAPSVVQAITCRCQTTFLTEEKAKQGILWNIYKTKSKTPHTHSIVL